MVAAGDRSTGAARQRRPSRQAQLGLKLFLATLALSLLAIGWLELRCLSALPEGVDLNRAAWEASYRERGERIPDGGPREGYWGSRLGSKAFDRHTGWREQVIDEAGRVSIDEAGMQHWEPQSPARHRVLFVGGSVAFGAYASSIERSYFADFGRRLEEAGEPARISVLAAGAWWSANELSALRRWGLDGRPDVVVFLDGLNDLTERRDVDADRRVREYLTNLEEARDRAHGIGAEVVFALQPALLEKRVRSDLERRILCLSCDASLPRSVLARRFDEMRAGLAGLASRSKATHLVDVSRIFADTRETTFADLWHFADAGHAALAEALAPDVIALLRGRDAPAQGADSAAAPSSVDDAAARAAVSEAMAASAPRA